MDQVNNRNDFFIRYGDGLKITNSKLILLSYQQSNYYQNWDK